MNILVIGQGPLPTPSECFCSFPQLRTWSMLQWLKTWAKEDDHQIHSVFVGPESTSSGLNVYDREDMRRLNDKAQGMDAVITCGPFYPLFTLFHIPQSIPLWLDLPSDPLADLAARNAISPVSDEESFLVQELLRFALYRADALGVISQRQRWATLGQRLLLNLPEIPIGYSPIAFEFPTPMRESSNAKRESEPYYLLSGSNNAWLDIPKLDQHLRDRIVHCTGLHVKHLAQQPIPNRWTQHGWLAHSELQDLIGQCSYGVWTDRQCSESLLGSRTRLLFYLWNGLTPIGDNKTELALELHDHGWMYTWNEFSNMSAKSPPAPIDIQKAQQYCQRQFSADVVYSPLKGWLRSPKHSVKSSTTNLHLENLRLREQIQEIHSSITWRYGSKFHKLMKKVSRFTGQ